jgi:hypothetical protein
VPRPEEVLQGEYDDRDERFRHRMPRCAYGSATDNPCWREATVAIYGGCWMACEKHAHLHELAQELNDCTLVEDVTKEWLRIAEAWNIDGLISLAERAHDDAVQEMVRMEAKVDLAQEIADAPPQGEGEPKLTLEQEEKLTELIHRADAFVDAYSMVEDVPEDRVQSEDRRKRIMGILAEAAEVANAEHSRYKEELGHSK